MNGPSPISRNAVQPLQNKAAVAKPATSEAKFGDLVTRHLNQANQHQLTADAAIEQLATGQTQDVQGVVMSVVEADLSLRMILEVRNRLVESYQEIMRMQV